VVLEVFELLSKYPKDLFYGVDTGNLIPPTRVKSYKRTVGKVPSGTSAYEKKVPCKTYPLPCSGVSVYNTDTFDLWKSKDVAYPNAYRLDAPLIDLNLPGYTYVRTKRKNNRMDPPTSESTWTVVNTGESSVHLNEIILSAKSGALKCAVFFLGLNDKKRFFKSMTGTCYEFCVLDSPLRAIKGTYVSLVKSDNFFDYYTYHYIYEYYVLCSFNLKTRFLMYWPPTPMDYFRVTLPEWDVPMGPYTPVKRTGYPFEPKERVMVDSIRSIATVSRDKQSSYDKFFELLRKKRDKEEHPSVVVKDPVKDPVVADDPPPPDGGVDDGPKLDPSDSSSSIAEDKPPPDGGEVQQPDDKQDDVIDDLADVNVPA